MTKGKKYRLTDVVWWIMQDEVMEEVAKLMDIDSANTSTPGWFPFRTTAAKNLLKKMSDAEKNQLLKKVEDMAENGFPKDVQRR